VNALDRTRRLLKAVLRAWAEAARSYKAPYEVRAIPAAGWYVYRTIGRSEPRDWDFKSDRDKGRPRAPAQDYVDYVGLSVFRTQQAALDNAVRFPKMVARVYLEEGCGFMIARTLADVEDHYTLWGDPDELLARVERPVPRYDDPG